GVSTTWAYPRPTPGLLPAYSRPTPGLHPASVRPAPDLVPAEARLLCGPLPAETRPGPGLRCDVDKPLASGKAEIVNQCGISDRIEAGGSGPTSRRLKHGNKPVCASV